MYFPFRKYMTGSRTASRAGQRPREPRYADAQPSRGNGSVEKITSTGTSKYAAMRRHLTSPCLVQPDMVVPGATP